MEGQTSTLLTDCPGFGDPTMHGDDRTVEKLLTHLQGPGMSNIHAIVLVEKYGTTRFSEAHRHFLEVLQMALGQRMWNHLVIVLTHFTLVNGDGANMMGDDPQVNQFHALRLVDERKAAWKKELR